MPTGISEKAMAKMNAMNIPFPPLSHAHNLAENGNADDLALYLKLAFAVAVFSKAS